MSIPLTLGLIGLTVGVAGSIAGAVSAHEAASEQSRIAEENAKLQQAQMEYNARMQEREAAAAEAENAENARRMREAAEAARSQRLAMLGKSGAAMTSGSPLAILGAAAADEELAIRDAQYSGAREVSALRAKATDYSYGAAIAKSNVNAARAAKPSVLSLGSSIAGTVGNAVAQGASLSLSASKINPNKTKK